LDLILIKIHDVRRTHKKVLKRLGPSTTSNNSESAQ
jgi:hypothetical protein